MKKTHREIRLEILARKGAEYFRAKNRRCADKLKREIVAAYGSECACCGEDEIAFLTIDHTKGGGKQHRRDVVGGFGRKFYLWLKRNNYPKDGFQLLCLNCNFAKGKSGGVCPHQLHLKDAILK